MKKAFGFTLIELMIAVAVIGLLAAIALPSYSGYIRKSNRRIAEAFMMDVAQREQQRLLDARSYTPIANNAAFSGSLGISVPGEITNLFTFTVTTSAGPPPGFSVNATALGNQDQNNDEDLVLRSSGYKARGDAATNSWDESKW